MAKELNVNRDLRFLKLQSFIPEYTDLEYSVAFRHKMRGIDGNKKPTEFTPEDKAEILKGVHKLAKELLELKA